MLWECSDSRTTSYLKLAAEKPGGGTCHSPDFHGEDSCETRGGRKLMGEKREKKELSGEGGEAAERAESGESALRSTK